jgi:Fe-S-cluster containining protein
MDNRSPQQRADAIGDKIDTFTVASLARRAFSEPAPRKKVIWLWKMGDVLSNAAKGEVVCDKGCSYCCHIPAMIHRTEAEAIAKLTGRKLTIPKKYVLEPNKAYNGKPCPMLKDGACSIYEHRPMTCRVHHMLDNDPKVCDVMDSVRDISYMDNREYHRVYVMALVDKSVGPEMADIRDFFS